MSLLTLIQAACSRLALPLPTSVMASGDPNVRVMRALATQEGRELARRAIWTRLTRETTFATVAAEVQPGAVPSDFDRFINNTVWNYTQRKQMLGPLEPQDWQVLRAGLVGPPDLYFRIRGADFLILPAPPPGEDIRFEYVSRFWIDTDADGAGDADDWQADGNVALLNEELLTLGVVWRFLKRSRLPYNDEFAEYNQQVVQAIGRDGARNIVNFAGRFDLEGPRRARIPDGSWNLP